MKRRTFLKDCTGGAAYLAIVPGLFAPLATHGREPLPGNKTLKLSLAQWSLHRNFFEKKLDPEAFAPIAAEKYGFKAVEYVNAFYQEKVENEKFWIEMKERSQSAGVLNLVMMVDDEGELGDAKPKNRIRAVENHHKWVNAAKLLGCHSVRVNAFGDSDRSVYESAIVDGMGRLAEYAGQQGINIVIENHGLYSSDAGMMVEVVRQVNLPNFGTFPDFGNWCLSAKWGSIQGACETMYDPYKGVTEMLPYAKAVSAKSYNFNEQGEHTRIDYSRMLRIVKESTYDGFIGIEYEGTQLDEHEGILATRRLIETTWNKIE